eukprot:XP_017444949.1 PREDICTED: coiled-coil domain-containing protein 172 isoform X5 [Rattus norvegicus]
MSLESLFQHIIFTEHQAEESRRVMREVRSEIARCRGKIKKATEDLNEEKIKLESKVQQFSEKTFLLELLKTRENALERQCSAIVSERDRLLQACEAIKKKTTEQEERFIKEITDFNDNYEITKKRDALMEEDIKLEMADLENQAEALRGEMKSMEYNSGQLQELQKLKSELLQELFTLQKKLKVLKDEETEAICITKHLEAEKIKIREKPQHDPECVRRLKRELDLYKEEDMESVCRALQIEVDLLESPGHVEHLRLKSWFSPLNRTFKSMGMHMHNQTSELGRRSTQCFTLWQRLTRQMSPELTTSCPAQSIGIKAVEHGLPSHLSHEILFVFMSEGTERAGEGYPCSGEQHINMPGFWYVCARRWTRS